MKLRAAASKLRDIDGLTIENRLALHQSVPADTLAAIKSCDVLLKGPTTTPKGGTMESANVDAAPRAGSLRQRAPGRCAR